MANKFNYPNGVFVPTTNVWDVSNVYAVEGISPQLRELLVRLYQNLGNMANTVNLKETGIYNNAQEFVTGNVWFPNPTNPNTVSDFRPTYWTIVDTGALPNATTKQVVHNIEPNSAFEVVRCYGAATLPDDNPAVLQWIPLPYPSTTLNNTIEVFVDGTNVNIITAIDYSAYIKSKVIVEYLKY